MQIIEQSGTNGTHEEQTAAAPAGGGLKWKRRFTKPGASPFDLVEWELRTCAISDDKGKTLFEQKDVEVPKFWSQMATNVVVSKYFSGEVGTDARERSVRQLIGRVVSTIFEWGKKGGYFASTEDAEIFRDELTHVLLHQYASFNSPVWFNVGVRQHPQCSACFIIAVEDTIDSMLELQTLEARLFKYGSGTGTNLSSIRSSKEKLGGGGRPSGPVSFMRGFDAWAGTIKSGGKTRRAAKMQILNVTHPDIIDFIDCKSKEEKKAWALIEQGYDGGFAVQGGAYDSVAFQNANLSVRVNDEFMNAVVAGTTYKTLKITDGKPCEALDAATVLRKIAEGTHLCGDPGIQFDDTINAWHTCPKSGRINASNPCSEYMHLDNSACNLSSINLLKYLKDDGTFDIDTFKHTVAILISAQDMLVDNSSYPTPKIGETARTYRQLGLGFANLGALLMNIGLPYDSDGGRALAAGITALMTGEAYKMSAVLAKVVKPFIGYKKNRAPMLDVIKKHRVACDCAPAKLEPALFDAAKHSWDEALELGTRDGYRNSQVTVLAPTGTISFMLDCDTTGIEPDIALVKYKKLVGGGFLKLVNQSVTKALKKLGYTETQITEIVRHVDQHDTIEGAPELKPEHLAVFDCAFKPANGTRFIHHQGHLKMMGAVQPYLSGAISKTVNLPKEATVEEIFDIYVDAWRHGLKAVALYRDGSKRTQPLSTQASGAAASVAAPRPVRRHLPEERAAITHKIRTGGLEGYLTVGLFEDGQPGEIFLVVAKEGSTLSGVMDAFATSVSMALQYGVPLAALVKKFSFVRFEPSGFTGNKDIPTAYSIIDYVFRWMALKFLTAEQLKELGITSAVTKARELNGSAHAAAAPAPKAAPAPTAAAPSKLAAKAGEQISTSKLEKLEAQIFQNSEDAPPCNNCGSHLMVRQAGCYVCLNCGAQGGCG